MKFKTSLFFLLSLVIFSAQAAKREQVLIVLSEPGLLTTISYTNLGSGAVGARRHMGKRFDNTKFEVSESEFRELWTIVNSETLANFEFEPNDEDNMAHPDFYNLTVISGRKEKSMRVPPDSDFIGAEELKLFIEREK